MVIRDYAVGQLALFAYREGHRLSPGCREAMLGIAHVISNRVAAGWVNGVWLRVIADAPIHSANNVEEMDWRTLPDPWDSDFRWLYDRCEEIYSGTLRDEITISADPMKAGGAGRPLQALFYGSLQNLTREWFKEKIVREPAAHPRTATAGTVQFFG